MLRVCVKMEAEVYNILTDRLDKAISHLDVSHPVPYPVANPHATGLIITPDLDVSQLSREQLSLAHSMLHLFHSNKSGRDLSQKTVERLHKEVSSRLKNHKTFDGLDEQ